MHLTMLLDMVADGMPDRVVVGDLDGGLTGAELLRRSQAGAALLGDAGADSLVYLAGNGPTFPVALFSAAAAGRPFLPVNYRLSADQLSEILQRRPGALVITNTPELCGAHQTITPADFMLRTSQGVGQDGGVDDPDSDAIAVLLMTSGTTAAPKSAVLRHRHLVSYILGSVEFMSADTTDATIVSVPPYHIAAVANLLSNLYAGRRIVYLDHFTAKEWLDKVETQQVTHAMVVPTMLVRIVEEVRVSGRPAPTSLTSVSYGGAKIAMPVLVEALHMFPDAGFVNAYGLTETASSIAILGPDDHRDASTSSDPAVRARLGSVGRALPSVEIQIQRPDGTPCASGEVGAIVVRGPQVAGEYLEATGGVDTDGWFATRDVGHKDEGGFIFIQGRSDDTIIRGGENIAPSEIEAVLHDHESVLDCAVAGLPDIEWGQRIAAFVVVKPGQPQDPQALRDYVRARLRSSKTPDEVVFLTELPTTATGKVLRRELVQTPRGEVATTPGG